MDGETESSAIRQRDVKNSCLRAVTFSPVRASKNTSWLQGPFATLPVKGCDVLVIGERIMYWEMPLTH